MSSLDREFFQGRRLRGVKLSATTSSRTVSCASISPRLPRRSSSGRKEHSAKHAGGWKLQNPVFAKRSADTCLVCECYPRVESEQSTESKKEASATGIPLPLTPREMVLQTAQSVFEAELEGKRLLVVDWLLPVNQRRIDFLITDPTAVQPTSIGEEFTIAITLASALLEGQEERGITSSRLDDGIDSEPVGLLTTDDNRYMAVVFPTADVIDSIRDLQVRNRESTIILVNPQWTNQGNIVSDFGFGLRKKRAEAFLRKFTTTYSLVETRIGNNLGPNFANGVRGVVRLLKASSSDWQIHVMSNNIGTLRMPVVTRKAYPSYRELCSLLTAYEMRRRGLTLEQLKEDLKQKKRDQAVNKSKKFKKDAGAAAEDDGGGAGQGNYQYVFFNDDEIENMDKRMLTAALVTCGINPYKPKDSTKETTTKTKNLTTEEMKEMLYERQRVMKTNLSRKVKRQEECRVCCGTGIRQCPLCINKGQKYGRYIVDLSCSVCGGHQFVICPACRGKNLISAKK